MTNRSSAARTSLPLAFAFFLAGASLASAPGPAAARGVKYASIVVDANSGEVLHAANPDTVTYPASTTKVMTLYLLFEALEKGRIKLNAQLPVSAFAAAQAPSKLGLAAGATIGVRDAMLGVVTKSANDAAVVLAEAIDGSESAFAERMTRMARKLGMTRTTFRNASGLPDPRQQTTARDLATLGLAIVRDYPRYYQVFATREFQFNGHAFANHNGLLGRYDGADGIKTGYIRASGFNLVASAERGGRRLVGVVLGGNSPAWRDRHMSVLLDKAFQKQRPPVQVAAADRRPALANKLVLKPPMAPEPVIPDDQKPEPDPVYVEDLDMDKPTVADLISDDAAEEIAASGDWGIQVGAYKVADAARRAADDARKHLPDSLKRAKTVVDERRVRNGRNGRVYQARLTGMTEAEARGLCKQLKKKRVDCFAVPPPVPGMAGT